MSATVVFPDVWSNETVRDYIRRVLTTTEDEQKTLLIREITAPVVVTGITSRPSGNLTQEPS